MPDFISITNNLPIFVDKYIFLLPTINPVGKIFFLFLELNAFKLEKIDKTDEIYNWEIFKEPNNTIAVFILEIPIKLDDLSKIAKIEVK